MCFKSRTKNEDKWDLQGQEVSESEKDQINEKSQIEEWKGQSQSWVSLSEEDNIFNNDDEKDMDRDVACVSNMVIGAQDNKIRLLDYIKLYWQRI